MDPSQPVARGLGPKENLLAEQPNPARVLVVVWQPADHPAYGRCTTSPMNRADAIKGARSAVMAKIVNMVDEKLEGIESMA
jgi:hypothetical protein